MDHLNGTCPVKRYEVKSGETVALDALVALNGDGKALEAADATGLAVVGVARGIADGKVEVEDGVFGFANDTTNAVTRAMRGKPCYVKDKGTVSSSGGDYKVVAGLVVDVLDGVVFVDVRPAALALAAHTAKVGAAVSDCTFAGGSATSAETQLNALLASLRAAGVIATA